MKLEVIELHRNFPHPIECSDVIFRGWQQSLSYRKLIDLNEFWLYGAVELT